MFLKHSYSLILFLIMLLFLNHQATMHSNQAFALWFSGLLLRDLDPGSFQDHLHLSI